MGCIATSKVCMFFLKFLLFQWFPTRRNIFRSSGVIGLRVPGDIVLSTICAMNAFCIIFCTVQSLYMLILEDADVIIESWNHSKSSSPTD